MKYTLIALLVLALGACSTIEGVGKDITATAVWSADKMKEKDKDEYQGLTNPQTGAILYTVKQ